jgi:radical SAM superfamily enzyme YgiQ (UPF0313 family)
MSDIYIENITRISERYWRGAPFLKRDIHRHIRSIQRMCYALGVLTLVSYIPRGADFTFVDENAEKPTDVNHLYGHNDYDLVVITAQVFQQKRVEALIDYFVERGIYVVVGGPNPTLFPDDYMKEGVSVVASEAENLFPEFLTDLADHQPKPIYENKEGDCVDLRHARVPLFSCISHHRYNLVGVQATRGCPHRCRFCNASTISGGYYRQKPVEQIREEIAIVKNLWPDSAFLFHDDNMFADRVFAFKLFEALQGIDLGQWTTSADISIAQDDELLALIASNGRPRICFGLETLSPRNSRTLDNRVKEAFQPRYGESIRNVQSNGIDVIGSFVFGFPGDSMAELDEMMTFIQSHGIHGSINRLFASPGSRLYDDLVREYEGAKGTLKEKGMARARVINAFYMEKNGFTLLDMEHLVFSTLKKYYPSELPMLAIGNLAAFRTFMR